MSWISDFKSWTSRLINRERWVGERILHDDGFYMIFKLDGFDYACPFCASIFPTRKGVLYHMNFFNAQCADNIPKTKRMRFVERPILILNDRD